MNVSIMPKMIRRRCHLIAALFVLLSVSAAARARDTVAMWDRWEHPLTSDRDYANPCTDVQVHVRFAGPNGKVQTGMGFWDGDRQFIVRCAFPTAGEWRWSTTCSDAANRGLNNRSGTVRVKRPTKTNPLVRHGYLRVSDDGRLLVHAGGTPFLWIGDTCWAAPVRATEKDWKRYVRNRAGKGYTVLQISTAPDWALEHGSVCAPPFLSVLPDITKPNPKFFQELDRKLALANDHGLVVLLVGLMETPYRYPPPEQVAVFSRYVAARYGSFEVIFSPSFDSNIHEAETLAAATAIREAAPGSLITMHMGTGVGPHFHGAEWLSFDMYQSGHNGGNAGRQSARATGMPAEILSLTPRKPIINGEAIYEGDLGGAYDVRRTAWLSFLSGAVGYTAGINQVYAWEEDVAAMMDAPSSDQVALLSRLLRALPWTDLRPAPERILNQPVDRARLMAFALTADKALGLVYQPGGKSIALNLEGGPPAYDTLWISPATGEWRDGAALSVSPEVEIKTPDHRDWVLLLATPESPAIAKAKKTLKGVMFHPRKSAATIKFGRNAPVSGLVRKSPRDGEFAYTRFDNVNCIVNEDPKRNGYLYIDVDDRLAFRGGPIRMGVEVRLHSGGPLDGIQLQYDAGGPAEVGNIYRATPPAWRKQRRGWSIIGFVAGSPYLGNRQNGGADFRVFLDGQQCHVASLKVTLDDGNNLRE